MDVLAKAIADIIRPALTLPHSVTMHFPSDQGATRDQVHPQEPVIHVTLLQCAYIDP